MLVAEVDTDAVWVVTIAYRCGKHTTMQLKNLFTDDRAVSPVIGVILMVAITVILAAVIGAFVLGIGSNQEKAPQASLSFNYDGSGNVKVLHDGGETIDAARLSLGSNFDTASATADTDQCVIGDGGSPSTFSAGDVVVGDNDGDGTETNSDCATTGASGDSLTITWTASSGDSSQILAESTIP